MFTSLFPAFIQWPFWAFCWPESSPHDLFERGFVQKGLWKWISCLHKYCSLHYSELPIWKESEIQGLGILCAIDLLKHLEEEAEALEGGSEFYMKTGAMRALWCSEIVHRCALRVLGTDGCVVGLGGGAVVEAKLKWQVSRGQPDTGEQAFNMSRLFQQAQVFIYCFQQISLE